MQPFDTAFGGQRGPGVELGQGRGSNQPPNRTVPGLLWSCADLM